jgi:hypothetical protein
MFSWILVTFQTEIGASSRALPLEATRSYASSVPQTDTG